ncbi:MAG TPA: AsmA family protein, partial [Anaeromyxobacteraceae bacterium]|nr:AsmA family protein [Anaeromyxobacteraceae bacterium]
MARSFPRSLRVVLAAVATLLLACVALPFVLDRILLSRARAEAAALSRTWGRPVEIGAISTRLVPSVSLRASGLQVGAAAGEPRPLVELARVEVRLSLIGTLLSACKQVDVKAIEVDGLRVNVLRLADGTTNLERFLGAAAPPKAAPSEEEAKPPPDLSIVRIDRAKIVGARLGFLDLKRTSAKEVFVDRLDITVENLRAGQPLEAVVRAAVNSTRQNLELRARATPLPPSLRPTLERVSVKLAPIELDPLAPFLPRSAGLLSGRAEADLDAALGAVVPGGVGPVQLRGGFALRGLRFRGQEGGRPLDVALDADLEGDRDGGNVRIDRLLLTAGPAFLTGSGRAAGLGSSAPRIERLHLSVRALDPRLLAAYYPPLRKIVGNRISGPIVIDLVAAGEAANPGVEARVDLTPVRLDFPGTLAKAAGAKLWATAKVVFSGNAIRVVSRADLSGVDLRPGGTLAKAPGERLAIEVEAARKMDGDTQRFELKRLDFMLPGDVVSCPGVISVGKENENSAVNFDLALSSARLDLDRLLLPRSAGSQEHAASAVPSKQEEPAASESLSGVAGKAEVKVSELRYARKTFTDVRARVRLEGDELNVEEARLVGLGGRASASGTRLQLAHPQDPAHVV